MSKQLNDLEKNMEEAGYIMSSTTPLFYGGSVEGHIGYYFEREDGREATFEKDWMRIVSLTVGFGYYVLPICRKDKAIHGLRLIRIKHVETIKVCCEELIRSTQSNYWVIQGEKTACRLFAELTKAKVRVFNFVEEMNKLMERETYQAVIHQQYLFTRYVREEDFVFDTLISMRDSDLFPVLELLPGEYMVN